MFRVYAVHISKTYIPPVKKPSALIHPKCYLRDAVADTYVFEGYNCIL